jgi:hypothetical protein
VIEVSARANRQKSQQFQAPAKQSTWRALFILREKARHQTFLVARPNVGSVRTLDDFGLAVE